MTGFRTDKVHPHGYLPDYLTLASKLPPDSAVCEIGVNTGASLEMWQCLLPDGLVAGVDNSARSVWPPDSHRIVMDQNDPELPGTLRGISPGGYDLIIDDASHIGRLTFSTFELLWPLIKPGCYYVVEDWADPWALKRASQYDDPGDDLLDTAPKFIAALNAGTGIGAETVTYTRMGLIIIRKATAPITVVRPAEALVQEWAEHERRKVSK